MFGKRASYLEMNVKVNLNELNFHKRRAFSNGTKGLRYDLKDTPKDWNYGHYVEICVANILGLTKKFLNDTGRRHSLFVYIDSKLDKNGVDFRINNMDVQLKTRYTYQTGFNNDWEFVVYYDLPGVCIIQDLFEFVGIKDRIIITRELQGELNGAWSNYMRYIGLQ